MRTVQLKKVQLSTLMLVALSACNGAGSDPTMGLPLGTDGVNGTSQPVPGGTASNSIPNPGSSTVALGASCQSSDPNRICLSLKYVVYEDSSGNPIISDQIALQNLDQINQIWSQCNIAFEIGEYLPVDPSAYGLNLNTATSSELTKIRNSFVDDATLLVVTTGAWSGSLGSGSANAWTSMPGTTPYGVVLEQSVGDYPNIIAHELGHYLNLDHVSDSGDVMSPVIYQGSTALSAGQCSAARSAAQYYWKSMLR